ALEQLTPAVLPAQMICFIGSTLGNLKPEEMDLFLAQVKATLQPGGYFLLGVDLQKSKALLEAAYNDAQGVTAEFNLNLLAHLNWRFQGDFDINQFEHQAIYNDQQGQIEMYLRSLKPQTIALQSLNLTVELAMGETILSEISRKFNLAKLQQELEHKGLYPLKVFIDEKQWFGLILCQSHGA
ncbi:MAG: L-histidine N(alpha)-methyltransferase, partial [Cyanothece sp. SIO1E1]|nr:L-histidine N(alpha)-methyltransferase [Cyanothece sp. SIO1E1]